MTKIKNILEYLIASVKRMWYDLGKDRRLLKMESVNKKLTIFDIANFFLQIVDRESGSTITPLKLQKILYYAQGYHLAMFNKELFNEEFQAWAHGPANPDIYNLYKHYGFSAIDKPDGSIPTLDKALIDFLYEIWNTYGIFDGKYLELLTHKELPWIEARGNCKEGEPCSNIIRKETMKSFFSEKINGN